MMRASVIEASQSEVAMTGWMPACACQDMYTTHF
jgi:hypothetical protein